MKFALKNLVVAAAFVAAGAANAGSTLTLSTGGSVTDQGWTVSGLTGSGTLKFSDDLLGALTSGLATVSQVSPATVTVVGDTDAGYTSITAAAPVTALTGSFDGSTVSVSQVATQGGALLTLPTDETGFISTGGFVSITNLRVDLTTNDVYATLIGGNGVNTVDNLKLWHIGAVGGATSFAAQEGTIGSDNTLTGLSIYHDAYVLFTQAAGLTPAGSDALAVVTDYGSISSTITVNATKVVTPTVPEPSTYALMGVGLLAMGAVARRRAK